MMRGGEGRGVRQIYLVPSIRPCHAVTHGPTRTSRRTPPRHFRAGRGGAGPPGPLARSARPARCLAAADARMPSTFLIQTRNNTSIQPASQPANPGRPAASSAPRRQCPLIGRQREREGETLECASSAVTATAATSATGRTGHCRIHAFCLRENMHDPRRRAGEWRFQDVLNSYLTANLVLAVPLLRSPSARGEGKPEFARKGENTACEGFQPRAPTLPVPSASGLRPSRLRRLLRPWFWRGRYPLYSRLGPGPGWAWHGAAGARPEWRVAGGKEGECSGAGVGGGKGGEGGCSLLCRPGLAGAGQDRQAGPTASQRPGRTGLACTRREETTLNFGVYFLDHHTLGRHRDPSRMTPT